MRSHLQALLVALAVLGLAAALPPTTARYPSSGVSISDRNVLLPHSSAKSRVPYTLRAYNGCFKWTNSNPDDILLTVALADPSACDGGVVVAPQCTTEAVISSQASSASGRTSATITAEDVATGHAVRCDVFLDRIARIEILTTTRTMHRDNVEELFVQAFDAQGNIFSSLENLHFQWSIMPSNPSEASGVLKFVTPDADARRETFSKLVHGISVGRATVAVRLMEAEYALVPAATAQLTVLEPLELSPAHTAYVTPGASLAYTLLTFKRGVMSPVEMPSPQYVWASANATVAVVDAQGVAQAGALGSSEISVQSVNLTENTVRSVLHVVPPGYLAQALLPLDPPPALLVPATEAGTQNWVLICGGHYATEAEVFDLAGHRIHVISNLRFTLHSAESRLLVASPANANASRHLLEPKAEGSASLTLTLTEAHAGGRWQRLTPPIVLRQDVLITSQVRLTRRQPLILPSDGFGRHSYTLHATGGSGEYTWHSSDGAVISVNGGLVTVQGRGDVTLVVADRRNVLNADSLPASALPPASLRLVPSALETQVGFSVTVAIVVSDALGRPFDNCSALPLEFVWTDGAAFTLLDADDAPTDAPLPDGACAMRSLLAVREGHGTLVLSLSASRLKDEATLFAYAPLTLSPASPALVTLGATLHVHAEGGPLPWLYEPTAYIETLEGGAGAARIAVRRVSRTHAARVWAVTCLEHGAQTLTVSVGNRPSPSNARPALLSAQLRFDCRWPDALVLHPVPAEPPAPVAPASRACADSMLFPSVAHLAAVAFAAPARYLLRGERTVSVNVTALDEHGRAFNNFSSLALAFASTNATLAAWAAAPPAAFAVPRDLALGAGDGTVTVSVAASDWLEPVLRAAGAVRPAAPPRRLQREVEVALRLNVQVSPTDALLLNHERNTLRISAVVHGSGVLQFATNASHVLTLLHEDGALFADVVPRGPGVARIVVTDLCLGGAAPVTITVRVADPASLSLRGRRFVRLGDSTPLQLEAWDERGVAFPAHALALLPLNFSADPDALVAIEAAHAPGLFTARALALGRLRLTAITRLRSGHALASASKPMEVYGPVRLVPHALLLVPDAVHQLYPSGGPSQEAELRWSSSAAHVANVSRVGVVQAVATGAAHVRVSLEGIDPDTKETLVYGADDAAVAVQLLSGLRVVVPAPTMDVGAHQTLRVAGTAGETPLSVGGLGLAFRWELSDPALLAVAPLSSAPDAPLSVRAHALLPGTVRVTVRLAVTPELRRLLDPRVAHLRELSASAALAIVEPLRLLGASVCGELLLPPAAVYRIATNRDGRHLSYHLLAHPDASDARTLDLSAGGVIEARRVGRAVVVVRDEAAQAQLAVQVTVRAPALLRLVPQHAHGHAGELPLGAALTLRIEVRDDTGRVFDSSAALPLVAHTSHAEVLALLAAHQWGALPANTTELHVRGVRPGEAVVRVALAASEGAEDFIRLRVANALAPAAPRVHLGGRVQLASTLASGVWRSENERVAAVSPAGLVEARAVGETRVHHTGAQDTHAVVQVVRVASIEALALPLVSGAAKQPTRIPLRFLDADGHALSLAALSPTNPVEHNVHFSCAVEGAASPWAYATHAHDAADHAPACVLHSKRPLAAELEGALPTSLTLVVRARDRGAAYEAVQRLALPFATGFALSRHGSVQLSARQPRLVLDVAVPPRVELVAASSDPARVLIRELPGGPLIAEATPDVRRFEIRTAAEPSPPFAGVTVSLLDPASGQEETLSVAFAPDAPADAPDGAPRANAAAIVAVPAAGAGDVGAFGLKPIDALMLAVFLFISALLVLAVRCLFAAPAARAGPAPAVALASPAAPGSAFAYTPASTPYKPSSPFRRQPAAFLASAALRRGPSPSSASPITS